MKITNILLTVIMIVSINNLSMSLCKKIKKIKSFQTQPSMKLCITVGNIANSGTKNNIFLTLTRDKKGVEQYYCTLNSAELANVEYCCEASFRIIENKYVYPPQMTIETGTDGLLVDKIGYYKYNYALQKYDSNMKIGFAEVVYKRTRTEGGTNSCFKEAFWVDADFVGGCKRVNVIETGNSLAFLSCDEPVW